MCPLKTLSLLPGSTPKISVDKTKVPPNKKAIALASGDGFSIPCEHHFTSIRFSYNTLAAKKERRGLLIIFPGSRRSTSRVNV